MSFLDEEIGKNPRMGLFDKPKKQKNLLKEYINKTNQQSKMTLKQKAMFEKQKSKQAVEDYYAKKELEKYKKMNKDLAMAKRKEKIDKFRGLFKR